MRDNHDILKELRYVTGVEHKDGEFRDAPMEWSRGQAEKLAQEEGVELTDDHWEAIRVLQACYAEDENPPMRRLHDALEARFDKKGGSKYLFMLFPGGPLAQGCRLGGLEAPTGSIDKSFGSVR